MSSTRHPHRPRLSWLLWLVIALLPLRGWAHGVMATDQALMPAVMVSVSLAQDTAAADETMAHPCHGQSAQDDTPQGDSATPASPHACQLCDLCHASLGPISNGDLALYVPSGTAPQAAPCPGLPPGRIGGLFRPPRTPAA